MEFLDVVLNVFSSGLPCCLLALGIFLTYRLLDFADLTAEGSLLIGSCVTAVLIFNGVNPWVATLVAFLLGAVCGIITGVLNRLLKIPKLLSGIITMTAMSSIAMIILGLQSGNPNPFAAQVSFINLVTKGSAQQTIYSLFFPWEDVGGIYICPRPWGDVIKVATMAAVVIFAMLLIYFFFGTKYGMAIRATGMNEDMARAQGINTDIATIVCIALANALIGLSGALIAMDSKQAAIGNSTGYLVVGLASIIIGEAIFGKRSFKNWLISVALGSIIYFMIVNIALRLGLPTELKSLLYAGLITIALCLPLFKMGINNIISHFKEKKVSEV